jgi:DNA helicase IV
VIILGLIEGRHGFPCEKPPGQPLKFLLPPRETFPYAEERRLFYEERRLFYVALTRARHRACIVYKPSACSGFVTELLDQGESHQLGADEFTSDLLLRPVVRAPVR